MQIRFLKFTLLIGAMCMVYLPLHAQNEEQNGGGGKTKTAEPAPKRDITGLWVREAGNPELSSIHSLTGVARGPSYVDMPPLTEWGQKMFDANKPGYGIRQQPEGNDPILRCMPGGVPRDVWGGGEFFQVPGKMIELMGGTWRQIETDGKQPQIDPPELRYDTGWMGKSWGHWEDDYTFVVETEGFNDKTWLSEEGMPHSDEMKLEERYTRVDYNTLKLNATIDDPKTYTKLYKVQTVTYRLGRNGVRVANFCIPDNEAAFQERIRSKAVETPDAEGNVH